MEQIIRTLNERADIIIFDSPPLLAVADARILATGVDAVIIVIDAGHTRSETCRRGAEMLAQVGVKPLGVVLNKFNPKKDNSYYGYSYYYYGKR
jgi:non-specific protein-tyrosine kinase